MQIHLLDVAWLYLVLEQYVVVHYTVVLITGLGWNTQEELLEQILNA